MISVQVGEQRPRKIEVPGVSGRDVRHLLISRDGSRLVAVVRTPKGDRVLVSRILHSDTGRVLQATGTVVLDFTADSTTKVISDIAWRSPTAVSVLTGTATLSQVETVSVDGSPGDLVLEGASRLRGGTGELVSSPVPRADVYAVAGADISDLTVPERTSVRCPRGCPHSRTSAEPSPQALARPLSPVPSLVRWRHARRPPRPRGRSHVRRLRESWPHAVPVVSRGVAGVPRIRWPEPTPPGLVTPWSVADYDGAVKAMIVGHKDRGQFSFARVLAGLLAESVRAVVSPDDGPVVLVPVPSRPGSSRRRGYDPMGTLVRLVAAQLRAAAYDVTPASLLVSSRHVVDQAGLSASERRATWPDR